MADRRKSLLDTTRRSNFLRESFGGQGLSRDYYITLLLREYEQWLVLYKKTKKSLVISTFKNTIKKENVANLSENDEAFLKSRPDYIAIADNANNYTELIMYWLKLVLSQENLYTKYIDDFKVTKTFIINNLLSEETEICTECDNGYCMKDIHYLVGRHSDLNEFSNINSLNFPDDD